ILTANGASLNNNSLGGTITLTEANHLSGTVTLSTNGSGADVSLTNAAPLALGFSSIGGNLLLTTTGAGSDITLNSSIFAFGAAPTNGSVTINSAGTISQTGSVFNTISAATLTGSSVGVATFGFNNHVSNFGPFTDTNGGAITLVN